MQHTSRTAIPRRTDWRYSAGCVYRIPQILTGRLSLGDECAGESPYRPAPPRNWI